MRTGKAAISLRVGCPTGVRHGLPARFSAINFRCHVNRVSGAAMVATCPSIFRPSFLAFAANRRRWSSLNLRRWLAIIIWGVELLTRQVPALLREDRIELM